MCLCGRGGMGVMILKCTELTDLKGEILNTSFVKSESIGTKEIPDSV